MTALIASTVATVLAPGWRCTESVIARSPFTQLAVLTDSTLSSTCATSDSLTGFPLVRRGDNQVRERGCIAELAIGLDSQRLPWSFQRADRCVRICGAQRAGDIIKRQIPHRQALPDWHSTRTAYFFCPFI